MTDTSQTRRNINYGVMPEQVTQQLTANSGSEFIVIQKVRGSEEARLWSSGDPDQTNQLFREAYGYLGQRSLESTE